MTEMTEETNKDLHEEVEELKSEADEILEDVEEIKEDLKEIKEELNKEEKEQENFKNKYFYLAAEMENMRKRYDREKENLIKYGNEKVLSGLLDVMDNLDRTMDAVSKDEDEKVKNIVAGIEMVRNQFMETLKANGLEQVKSLGEVFDPNFHEAMAQQPAEEHHEDQEVVAVYQQGYVLNGRLIRAAKVVIAKK